MKKPNRNRTTPNSSASSSKHHNENIHHHHDRNKKQNQCSIKHFDKITDDSSPPLAVDNNNPNSSCRVESTMPGFENKFIPKECVRYGKYSPVEAYSIDMHSRFLNIYASVQGSTIYIWKFGEKSSQMIHMIENEQKQMEYYCVKWGRWNDRDVLAVCGSAQFVSFYQVDIELESVKSKYIGTLNGHGNSVYCICFHPQMNGLVLTGSTDHSIRLWDLNLNFDTVAIFQSHLAGIISLSFHISGDYFVSGAMDNTCRIFKIDDQVKRYINFQKRYHELENESGEGRELSSKSLKCTCNSEIHALKVPIIKSSSVYLYHRGYVDSCLFLGDVILSKTTSSESSTNDPGDSVIVWKPDSVTEESGFNVESEEDEISIVHRFKGSQSLFWWLKMGISDKYLARPLHDGRVELFSFDHVGLSFYSRPCAVLHHSSELVRECIFSKDSKYLFVLQSNGKISRWIIN